MTMTATWGLFAYLAAVVAGTLLHAPTSLASALVVTLVLSGPGRLALLRRALGMVAAPALVISVGYGVMTLISGAPDWVYLLRINLRLTLLTVLTAWMLRDLDLAAALAPWPGARRWLGLVRIQLALFRRLGQEVRLAQRSRQRAKPPLRERYRTGAALGLAALDKAMHNSEALTQGMRSRGVFNER
ncbi:hypothetical protein ACN2MM_10920 [Alkalilimnicola ehrlichii MLHE-1]|uniref:Cobalt transport protein n=1 Tax=Alkalilimnicola ehrlichii (strain ATCC BAA-1101 / DSM 17681 / MLHE-1) TaxID=187272 RepID=Q0A711_ALKEH|nr:hypothetical protein [Alkalilimnicola ehrlichii]ABI57376.1 hypothetical protein Mlg_2034 [Alkalilimnicola ehrlichii MLHE-1]